MIKMEIHDTFGLLTTPVFIRVSAESMASNSYEPSMKCNCDAVVPIPLSDAGE